MEKWHVAKTKPRKERLVETYLTERQGVEVFLPLIHRPSYMKDGLEPLFPSYIFCLVDQQSPDWPAIRWAPGLSYFLSFGGGLATVSDELVFNLKERVYRWNEGICVPRFTPGEQVVVTSGPFSGLEVIFQRYIPSRQRCQVFLQILGHLARVEVPAEVLEGKLSYGGLALVT